MKKILIGFMLISLLSLTGCTVSDSGLFSSDTTINSDNEEDNNVDDDYVDSSLDDFDSDSVFEDDDFDLDYEDSEYTTIALSDGSSSYEGDNVEIVGDVITIVDEGTFVISGSLSNGQVVIDTTSETKLKVILDGVSITNTTTSAFYIKQADKVYLTLADDTINTLNSTIDESLFVEDETDVDAALYSADDLTINGLGTLNIYSEDGNGITSKDDLIITSGIFNVESDLNGFEVNDSLSISDGTFAITTAGGYENAPDKEAADSSGGGQTGPGNFGWGSSSSTTTDDDDDLSRKAMKCDTLIYIEGGTFVIDAYDDAIHSNTNTYITGGTFSILTADDGITSEFNTVIDGGDIEIGYCYEGLEGQRVTINGGRVNIYSMDDGINASPSDIDSDDDSVYIKITGGNITIDSNDEGDGIDSNGSIYITGGYTLISATTTVTDTPLDYEDEAIITGGTFIGSGVDGQTTSNFTDGTTQGAILYDLGTTQNSQVTLTDSEGNVIVQYTPTKSFDSVIMSSPDIKQGETYTLTVGTKTYTITMASYVYGEGEESSSGGPSRW